MIVDLFLLAACGGVFSVPLYAIIQDAAAPSERSRMIAANNIMNALFMVAGAAAAAALAAVGLRAPAVLHVAAVANLFVALWIVRILPHEVYRAILRWYFRRFHGVQVHGLENYRAAGDRAVIVANHQSYLDACLIAACPARQSHLRDPHSAGREMVCEAVPRRGRYVSGGCAVALFGEAHGRGGA